MKIQLKKISYSARLSEETPAFAADIWIDGVKAGEVRNEGQGGPNRYSCRLLEARLEEHAKTLPPLPSPYGGPDLPMCADLVIADLLDVYLAEKAVRSALKSKTMFTMADGKLYTTRGPAPAKAVKVLNTMPFGDAVAVYLEMTRL